MSLATTAVVVMSVAMAAVIAGGLGGEARGAAEASLVILERDTVQTRNYQPVINHQAMVVNASGDPVRLDIVSPIPEGRDVRGQFYPAFGRQSALAVPMQSPWALDVSSYRLLEEPPRHRQAGGGRPAAYFWEKVTVAAREAVIAQYDNYFGPKDMFYSPSGIDIAGLETAVDYAVTDLGAGKVAASLKYRLVNRSQQDILELSFRVFVPDTVIEDSGPVRVVEVTGTGAPPHFKPNKTTMADGLGRVASGNDFFLSPRTLAAGEAVEGTLKLNWRVAGAGEIHPTIAIQGRGEGARLWPETQLAAADPIKLRTFYYRMWNIVLPDRCYVIVGSDGRMRVQRR